MQLSAPVPRSHKVLMSFGEKNGCWFVAFWDNDRMRTPLPRKAFFHSDEALIEFTRRAGGPKTLEDRNIFEMQMRRSFGEITLQLNPEQFARLQRSRG
jgi:hypothetical protein